MENPIYNEQIEQFVKGRLPSDESAHLRTRMATDSDFRRLVLLHQYVFEGIKYKLDKDNERNQTSLQEPFKSKIKKFYFVHRPKIMSIAASLIVLIFINVEYFSPWLNQGPRIDHHLQQDMTISLEIASETDQLLFTAQQAFNEKKYKEASLLFDEYLKDEQITNYEVKLYQGIALRHAQQTEDAIKILKALVDNKHLHYSGEEAAWQLALAYLQAKDYSSARQQLNQIIDDGKSSKHTEAKDLLRSIRFL